MTCRVRGIVALNCTRRFCRAALQRKISAPPPLGFPCRCINSSSGVDRAFRSGAEQIGELHGCNTRQSFARPPRQLAHAAGHHHLRLRDRAVELRAALEPRLLRAADEPRIRLGPRRVRPRAGAAEPAVGTGPADRRRDRRSLRRLARDVRRRAALCRRPVADALFGDAAVARSRRRRPDRLRAVGLLVQPGAVGVQQAAAAREARHRARRRHRRRFVRAIPVRAVRRGADRQFRLADGADGIRAS